MKRRYTFRHNQAGTDYAVEAETEGDARVKLEGLVGSPYEANQFTLVGEHDLEPSNGAPKLILVPSTQTTLAPADPEKQRRHALKTFFGAMLQWKAIEDMVDNAMANMAPPITFRREVDGVLSQVSLRDVRRDQRELTAIALNAFDDLVESGFARHWCPTCKAPLVVDPADKEQTKRCVNPACGARDRKCGVCRQAVNGNLTCYVDGRPGEIFHIDCAQRIEEASRGSR